MDKKNIRITKDNYKRPKTTFQDTLQNNEAVREKLEGYVQLDDTNEFAYLPQNTPIRYITIKNGEYLFRLGGLLVMNKPEYIVLKSITNVTWCVQKEGTIFYRGLTKEEQAGEIIKQHENLIEEQQKMIEELRRQLENKY